MSDFTTNDFSSHKKNDLQKALQELKIKEKQLPENHPDLAKAYDNILTIYFNNGDFEKAMEYGLKALKIREKVLDENHPDLAESYNNISVLYHEKGEDDIAFEYALKALKIREKIFDRNHPALAESYSNISTIYNDKGERDKALEFAHKAVEIREQNGKDKKRLAISYNNIFLIYLDKRDYDSAMKIALKAQKIYESEFDRDDPGLGVFYSNLARLYYEASKSELVKKSPSEKMKIKHQAYDYICKAVDIFKKKLPANHNYLQLALAFKSIIAMDTGNFDGINPDDLLNLLGNF